MTAAAVLARLDEAGVRVGIRPDGGMSLRPVPASELLAEARRHRDDIVLLVTLRRAVANDKALPPASDDAGPIASCATCRHNLWWRLSALSGGPGPWRCMCCIPLDPDVWIDGCAVPTP
jgi:hypothetical protein